MEHGVACIRRDDCAHDYLLAFSCHCRCFCPSRHAKRLAFWTQWLDDTLLAPVPHRASRTLTWLHSEFHVPTAVWVPEDDRAFANRLARYCARNPVALERLTYDQTAKAVTYRSDKADGPTAGTETADPLEFLDPGPGAHPRQGARHNTELRLVCQSPARDAGQGGNRCGGRAARHHSRATTGAHPGQPPMGESPTAALLQQIDPLACASCHGAMRTSSPASRNGPSSTRSSRTSAPAPRRRPTPPRGVRRRGVRDRAVRSPDTRPSPIKFPILKTSLRLGDTLNFYHREAA